MKTILKYIVIAIPVILIVTALTFYILKLPNQEKESRYMGLISEGNSYISGFEYAKAINSFSEAAVILDSKSEAYEGIAQVLVVKNQLGQLADLIEQSTQKVSNDKRSLLYSKLAQGYLENGNQQQAQTYFQKAVDLDYNNELAKLGLAQSYIKLGDMGKAKNYLDTPSNSVNYEKAYILKLVTTFDNYDELKTLVEQNPSIVDATFKKYQDDFKSVVKIAKTETLYISAMLSRIYVNMGYPNLAITLFEKQTDENLMEYGDYVYVVAVANYNLGNYTKALELLGEYNNANGDPDVYLLQARSSSNTEEDTNTQKYFELAIASSGDKSDDIYIEYVDYLLDKQEFEKAKVTLDKADKTMNENWIELGYLRLYTLEKNSKVTGYIEKLLKSTTLTDPEKKEMYYWAITYYIENQLNNDATIQLARLKELDKNNPQYYYLSGKLNLQLANPNDAKGDLEKAIDLDITGDITESAKKLLSRVD